ncbi:MAG: type II secretion system F family protein [Rhodoglobus sp.]
MNVLTWEYAGRDSTGKAVKGRVDAQSEAAAVSKLRTLGVAPLSIKEAGKGTGLNQEINLKILERRVGLKDLSIMSRQMATMVGAGLSLLQTLHILAEQTSNKRLAGVLDTVRTDVETGVSLSDAVYRHQEVFPPIMISLIRAGETGGFLELSLEAVATNFEKEVKLRDRIKSALTYPVIVFVMSILGVIAMLVFIVPVFKKMFEDIGSSLPAPTQILVTVSENMVWIGPALAIGTVAFTVWWGRNKNTERVRRVVDPLKLKLPVFGGLIQKIAIARVTRNLATMIASGVPILRSLAIVGDTSGNFVVAEALRRVSDSVRKGQSIARPLATEKVFPPMVVQMIAVGEDAGALEQMLHKIAEFYDDEVAALTEQLTALIEPLVIAFLGIVIGGMVVALYMPIFSIIGEVQ